MRPIGGGPSVSEGYEDDRAGIARAVGKKTPDSKPIENDTDLTEGLSVVWRSTFGQGPAFHISYASATILLNKSDHRIQRA